MAYTHDKRLFSHEMLRGEGSPGSVIRRPMMPCGRSRDGASPCAVKDTSSRCLGPATRHPSQEGIPRTVTTQSRNANVALDQDMAISSSKHLRAAGNGICDMAVLRARSSRSALSELH